MSEKIGEVRNSQLISTFGPGAIVDLPDFSVIIAGLDHWNTKLSQKITEPRLVKKLGILKILTPPRLEWDSDNKQGTLPSYRFPRYMVCPSCRKLALFNNFYVDPQDGVTYCHCGDNTTKVFPARFIVSCPKGHIGDFPWHYYVHAPRGNFKCSGNLRLNDKGVTGSIADVEVECIDCGQNRTLQDAFMGKGLPHCQGTRPWLRTWDKEDCDEKSRPLLRGASNLYFPVVESALSIPPYTTPVHKVVAEEIDRMKTVNSIEKLRERIAEGIHPDLEDFDVNEIWEAILYQRSIEDGAEQDLLYPEWLALLKGSSSHAEPDFETEDQVVPTSFRKWIGKIITVRRLTEVRVLSGFSRIEPIPDATSSLTDDQETAMDAHMASLSHQKLPWRPGIATHGEGIFITLDEMQVQKWERRFNEYPMPMKDAFVQYCKDRNLKNGQFPGPRYVLLHSLSHALMRQLCLGSGYSSTSLRERIYSRCENGQRMAGILIYTSTPDSEGSLGGLVELGQSDNIEEVLWNALQEARFCSSDPLCAEHKPDSIGDLNGAACHACQLAAETSCEKSNRFLDRSFLVPTVSEQNLAYFV